MIGLLEAAAAAQGPRSAVIGPDGSISYQDLLHQARAVATGLTEAGVTRFAVAEADAAWVIRLLAGAAHAGAEPCQYQPDTSAQELAEQMLALGHEVVVTRRTDLGGLSRVLDPRDLRVEGTTPPVAAQSPLLIRTTGTTGQPKAARHDWNVLARTAASTTPRPDQRWLLAYGPHQFAGIQVLQHVLASHATLVAPFPRQPRDGLRALLEHGVTCVSATPTYWRFLLAEARSAAVDLPSLEQITLGGEPTPDDLLAELRRIFPEARISHVYASTEHGSIASVTDGRAGFPVDSLAGPDHPDGHLRILDGELWVRARAAMLGYADQGGAENAADGWRPTGDLVEINGDRVLFRGRAADIINVGGVKVSPLQVEERIAALDSVALARVFGRANRLTGAIVAVDVVPEGGPDRADLDAIRQEIKEAVAGLPRAWHPRSVRFVEAIATRGDKTVRGVEQ